MAVTNKLNMHIN